MSIFTNIEAAAKSTVKWLESELAKLVGAAPTIEKVIDTGLSYINPVLQIALTSIGDAPAAAVVNGIIVQAQSDLLAASALVTDFGPTPTAASIFLAVKTNLNGLLTAGHVTNPTSVQAVTKAVNEVGALGAAVGAAVTAIGAAATPTTT